MRLATILVGFMGLLGGVEEARPIPALSYLSVPPAATSVLVDGRLDEAAWADAAVVRSFAPALQPGGLALGDPVSAGEAATTEARLLWRPEALYLGFICRDSRILASPERHRDESLFDEDVVEAFLDPVGDGRRYWEVQVSPRGQVADMLHLLDADPPATPGGRPPAEFWHRHHLGLLAEDLPGLAAAAVATGDGWSVELAIPAAALPRTAAGPAVFAPGLMRLNLVRYDWSAPRGEPGRVLRQASWSPVEHGCPHQSAARMAWIELIAAKER